MTITEQNLVIISVFVNIDRKSKPHLVVMMGPIIQGIPYFIKHYLGSYRKHIYEFGA